jgi:carboxylesterase
MKGCLLIHGFTGSPDEVKPIATYLTENTDWLVRVPTLPGHGDGESLGSVTWQDWIKNAEEELLDLSHQCDELYLVGFSMGGLISAYLSTKFPIKKLVLLSAAVFYFNPEQIFKDIGNVLQQVVIEKRPLDENMKRYGSKWKTTPLTALFHFGKLVKELRPSIQDITVPILIIQGEKDDLVRPKSAQYIYERVRSEEKEILYLPESKHVICHDCELDQIIDKVDRFLIKEAITI